MRYLNFAVFMVLLVFTSYVLGGDTAAVRDWYAPLFVGTFVLVAMEWLADGAGAPATFRMWLALGFCVVWLLWEMAATYALLTLPHLRYMLHEFNGTLAILLLASIVNFGNVFRLFGRAFGERFSMK